MRVIVHLSDIHFGRIDPSTVQPLAAAIRRIAPAPDLLAVSGDLTQRARRTEFAQAREFLDSLPFRRLVVPGNHDVPLYNVFTRFATPLARYTHAITSDLFVLQDRDNPAWNFGGRLLMPAMDIPGVGRFAVIFDPQGAAFALITLNLGGH